MPSQDTSSGAPSSPPSRCPSKGSSALLSRPPEITPSSFSSCRPRMRCWRAGASRSLSDPTTPFTSGACVCVWCVCVCVCVRVCNIYIYDIYVIYTYNIHVYLYNVYIYNINVYLYILYTINVYLYIYIIYIYIVYYARARTHTHTHRSSTSGCWRKRHTHVTRTNRVGLDCPFDPRTYSMWPRQPTLCEYMSLECRQANHFFGVPGYTVHTHTHFFRVSNTLATH